MFFDLSLKYEMRANTIKKEVYDMVSLPEPFKIHSVEPIKLIPREERERKIREVHYIPSWLKAEDVFIDLVTDSGLSSMSNVQWSALMLGDESYAGPSSFFKFEKTVKDIFGFKYVLAAHQGRAAEALFTRAMIKPGQIVPANKSYSPVMVEDSGGTAVDLMIDEALKIESQCPFKGNLDVDKLKVLIEEVGAEKIAYVLFVMPNNNVGSQPVSMSNLREVRQLASQYGLPVAYDGARFAENAYFIKEREPGYQDKSIVEITREMMSYADGCFASLKKTGLANMGAFVAVNDDKLFELLQTYSEKWEGFPTNGGLAGRDLEAAAVGLRETVDEDFQRYYAEQVRYLGKQLQAAGITIVTPPGGHAVFISSEKFCPHIPVDQYRGVAIGAALYVEGGIRGYEYGALGKSKRDKETGEILSPPELDLFRLSIPRRLYTSRHMDYVAEVTANVFKNREKLGGFKLVYYPAVKAFTHLFGKLQPVSEG